VVYLLLNAGRTTAKFITQKRDDHVQDVLAYLVLGHISKNAAGDLTSVSATAGSRPILAGWLGCSNALVRYSDVAGVSQSDWPLRVY